MTQPPADPIALPLDAAPPPRNGDDVAAARGGSLPLDLISGYALTAARIAAWAGVSALVFRGPHPSQFALLVLLRGTITLVGYTSLGLGPAMVRMLAATRRDTSQDGPRGSRPPARPTVPAISVQGISAGPASAGGGGTAVEPPPTPSDVIALDYQTPRAPVDRLEPTPEQQVFASGALLGWLLATAAVAATVLYADAVAWVHVLSSDHLLVAPGLVIAFGVGTALRIASEPSSAALQARGRLAVDNYLSAAAEIVWLALVAADATAGGATARDAGAFYLIASFVLMLGRLLTAAEVIPDTRKPVTAARPRLMWAILTFGAGVLVAQLADFLYAPAAYVVINRLLSPADLVAYAPAVQIDGALLLLVGGLAAALFPRAAAAHAAGDLATVRRYYLLGTAASAAVLAAAAGVTVLLSEWLLVAWLGEDLAATRAILPLVLVHTVVGGSAAVGRSVLLGMGRVRALTASALVAGVLNVLLGIALAAGLGWGLRGIVLATMIVVVARAGIWMPWYVLRTLRRESARVG